MPIASASLDDAHAFMVSLARLGRGLVAVAPAAARPARPLELYEMESCPFCRKVRDVLTELDLGYVSHPVPTGSRNRATVEARGGKAQFPYLVDPNTGRELYESEDIIDYLCATYGTRPRPRWMRWLGPLDTVGASVASAIRPRGGKRAVPGATDREPLEQTLVLYSFEASPYCRKVREALHELDLDFRVVNVGKRSPTRPELVARGGKMQVPYLIDPNAGVEMYESDDIVRYLHATYG